MSEKKELDREEVAKALSNAFIEVLNSLPDEIKDKIGEVEMQQHCIPNKEVYDEEDMPQNAEEFLNLMHLADSENVDSLNRLFEQTIQHVMSQKDYMIVPLDFTITSLVRVKAKTPIEAVSFIAENYDEISKRLSELNMSPNNKSMRIPTASDIEKLTVSQYYDMIPNEAISTIE